MLLIGFVASIVLARLLGPSGRGLLGLMLSVNVLAMFVVARSGCRPRSRTSPASRTATRRRSSATACCTRRCSPSILIPLSWLLHPQIADAIGHGAGGLTWVLVAVLLVITFLDWTTQQPAAGLAAVRPRQRRRGARPDRLRGRDRRAGRRRLARCRRRRVATRDRLDRAVRGLAAADPGAGPPADRLGLMKRMYRLRRPRRGRLDPAVRQRPAGRDHPADLPAALAGRLLRRRPDDRRARGDAGQRVPLDEHGARDQVPEGEEQPGDDDAPTAVRHFTLISVLAALGQRRARLGGDPRRPTAPQFSPGGRADADPAAGGVRCSAWGS